VQGSAVGDRVDVSVPEARVFVHRPDERAADGGY